MKDIAPAHTVTRTISVPEHKLGELKRDVIAIMDPHSLAYNDGWAAKAFIDKWGFTVNDAQQVTGRYVVRAGFEK